MECLCFKCPCFIRYSLDVARVGISNKQPHVIVVVPTYLNQCFHRNPRKENNTITVTFKPKWLWVCVWTCSMPRIYLNPFSRWCIQYLHLYWRSRYKIKHRLLVSYLKKDKSSGTSNRSHTHDTLLRVSSTQRKWILTACSSFWYWSMKDDWGTIITLQHQSIESTRNWCLNPLKIGFPLDWYSRFSSTAYTLPVVFISFFFLH